MYAVALIGLSAASAFGQCTAASAASPMRVESTGDKASDVTLSGVTCTFSANITVLVTSSADISNNSDFTARMTLNGDGLMAAIQVEANPSTGAPNQMSFTFTNAAVTGNGSLVLSRLYLNANKAGTNQQLTVSLAIVGTAVTSFNNNPVGFVLGTSLAAEVVGGATGSSSTANPNGTLRASDRGARTIPTCVNNNVVTAFIRITENFQSVLRNATGTDNVNTRVRFNLTGIPSGVEILFPRGPITSGSTTLTRASTSNIGSAVSNSTIVRTYTPRGADGYYAGDYGPVTTEAIYDVTATDTTSSEILLIPIIVRVTGGPSVLPGTTQVRVALGPTGSGDFPRFTTDNGTAVNLVTTSLCATSLLFPYVTNAGGFDTGLAISNTTADPAPFTTANQSGTCALNYFGSYDDGGALPSPAVTSAVAAGRTAVMTLTGGGSGVAGIRSGFSGYMIAQCQFQLAHGFAFVSDLGARNLAMGYLALVLTVNEGSRSGAAGAGQEALNN
jgi:hypothetical protein